MFKRLIRSQALRRRTAWAIAGILVLPFILFFHASWTPRRQGPGGAAGELFGRAVPWEEFQQQRFWVRRQFVSQLGGDVPEEFSPLITRYTWERLILLAEAKRRRLRASDEALAAAIRQIPGFQEAGRFIPERYHRFVSALGMTPTAFEGVVRDDLLVEQLVNSVRASVTVTDEELQQAYRTAHERARVSLILSTPERFRDEVQRAITEDDLRAEYADNPEAMRRPGEVTFDLIGRRRDDLVGAAVIPDEDITAYYESHQEAFLHGETTAPLEAVREEIRQQLIHQHVSRQLIALAIDLEDGLKAGRSFDDLAASQELSVRSVGPLSVEASAAPSVTEPELLKTAATLEVGAASQVIETAGGVYVLRVTRQEPSRIPSFEEVHDAVDGRLVERRAREAARASTASLREALSKRLAEGAGFEDACRALKVIPNRPPPFTRTEAVEPLGQAPSVNAAAFATAIGALSELLETPSGTAILLVHERIAADEAGFTPEEQARLREQVLGEKQQAHVAQWLAEVRSRAKLRSFVDEPPSGS